MKEIIVCERVSHKTLEYKNDIFVLLCKKKRSHADGIFVIDCLCQRIFYIVSVVCLAPTTA